MRPVGPRAPLPTAAGGGQIVDYVAEFRGQTTITMSKRSLPFSAPLVRLAQAGEVYRMEAYEKDSRSKVQGAGCVPSLSPRDSPHPRFAHARQPASRLRHLRDCILVAHEELPSTLSRAPSLSALCAANEMDGRWDAAGGAYAPAPRRCFRRRHLGAGVYGHIARAIG